MKDTDLQHHMMPVFHLVQFSMFSLAKQMTLNFLPYVGFC